MSAAPGEDAGPQRRRRVPWTAVTGAALIAAVLAMRWFFGGGSGSRLPVYGEIPPFQLVERSGRPLTRDTLPGTPWVVDFIFTRCSGTCPVMTSSMSRLASDPTVAAGVRFLSISVDPAFDTSEVLRGYAEGVAADPERWLFATGDEAEIFRLSRAGFKLGAERAPEETAEGGGSPAAAAGSNGGGDSTSIGGAGEEILHSSRFVLLDKRARIRGYYDGMDDADVARLARDAKALARERDATSRSR